MGLAIGLGAIYAIKTLPKQAWKRILPNGCRGVVKGWVGETGLGGWQLTFAEKVKKKAKLKVTKLSEMANEKVQDKLGVDDGKIKKRRGRPKKFQTLAEVQADINLREFKKAQEKLKREKEKNKKAKIAPSKLLPPPEAGLEKIEENLRYRYSQTQKLSILT